MRSAEEIVELFERKTRHIIPVHREYLVELIDTALKEAYQTAQDEVYILARAREKKQYEKR